MRLCVAAGSLAVVASLVVVGGLSAGEAVKSGLKPGEPVGPFQIDAITGPQSGTSLFYR